MSKSNQALLLGFGAAGIGLIAVAAMASSRKEKGVEIMSIEPLHQETIDPGAVAAAQAGVEVPPPEDWRWKVLRRVSQHEGGYDSVNRNADGAGLSFGILQWVQMTGTLGVLLEAMFQRDPQRFTAIFGPDFQALLQATKARKLGPVAGAVLWKEPWVSRFVAAGREPVFQAVQNRLAVSSEYMTGAIEAAEILGFVTERSVTLMYDTAVQQGPGFAKKLARRVRDEFEGQTVPMKTVLTRYAQLCPAHFKRTTPPTKPYPVSHIEWRQVGPSEWHAFAGRIDLYEDVLRRRMGIVGDGGLETVFLVTPHNSGQEDPHEEAAARHLEAQRRERSLRGSVYSENIAPNDKRSRRESARSY